MIVSFWCVVCRKNAYVTIGTGPVRCLACGTRDLRIRILADSSNENGYDAGRMRHVLGCKIAYVLEAAP